MARARAHALTVGGCRPANGWNYNPFLINYFSSPPHPIQTYVDKTQTPTLSWIAKDASAVGCHGFCLV